jgi:putative phosphoesterase
MYRIAVISDVHADLHALRDALTAIDGMQCDAIVCAGDAVDYGLWPDETIALLAERQIPTVRGNHDRWAATAKRNQSAWSAELSPKSRRWLGSLRTSLHAVDEGVRVAVHHASPVGDMRGLDPGSIDAHEARHFLKLADADVLIVGHTHVAFRIHVADAGVIVNPAALLRDPAEGADNPPATGTFGVLELPSLAFTVHRACDGKPIPVPQFRAGSFPERPTRRA